MAIKLRLSTAADVRRTLARITNMAINGKIDTKLANTIILACNAILSAIRTDEQQKKIDELEQIINQIYE